MASARSTRPRWTSGRPSSRRQTSSLRAPEVRAALEKAQRSPAARAEHAPLLVRRSDAIPVALPLKAPMKMAGVTITKAENLIVRVELADGQVGWGEAPSAPTMTGDTPRTEGRRVG